MRTTRPTIYNPAEEPKEQLVDKFVIRTEELQKILGPLKEADPTTPPQHYLIAGQRGMGKTTLLLRIKYAIEDDTFLNQWLIPVRFSEEQYNIGRLERLWEETAQLLENKSPFFAGLYDEMQTHEDSNEYEEKCLELLTDRLKQNNKRVVLLIDNIGELFDKFSDTEAHRLREVLITNAQIQIIGGSSRILEHTFRYEKPFFEFFNQIKLEPLSQEESQELLQTLGRTYDKEVLINEIITKQPERIEVMRRLTGGVPRTVVLLFEIFVDHESGSAFEDLQYLLDSVNSLYKHRMDELKPQQQQIVDALAKAWEPISAAEVLEKSKLYRDGMQSNQISSQLGQLEENQVVESVAGKGKKKTYRIRERFFNIWYLMRHGKKQSREEVLWLVKFLEDWCTTRELLEMANSQLIAMQKGDYSVIGAYMKTMALQCIERLDNSVKRALADGTEKYLHGQGKHEWAENVSKIVNQGHYYISLAVKAYQANNLIEAEKNMLLAVQDNETQAMVGLGKLYGDLRRFEEAEKYLLIAFKDGFAKETSFDLAFIYEDRGDITNAIKYYEIAANAGDDMAMNNLALLYEDINDEKNALKFFEKASNVGSGAAAYNLGIFYNKKNDINNSEKNYLLAIARGHIDAYNNLATLYHSGKKDILKAEQTLLEGLSVAPDHIQMLFNYVAILFEVNRVADSLKYLDQIFSNTSIYTSPNRLFAILNALLFFHQYNFLLQQFQKPDSLLMKHAKPYYYAVAYFLKNEMPGEYEKAGAEIKETVDEIIQSVLPKKEKKKK